VVRVGEGCWGRKAGSNGSVGSVMAHSVVVSAAQSNKQMLSSSLTTPACLAASPSARRSSCRSGAS
jgi:hypothetical protein